jgi:hypothetical protein
MKARLSIFRHRQMLVIALVTALTAALVPAFPVAAVAAEPGSYRDTFDGDADGTFPSRWSVVNGVGDVSVRTVEDGRKTLHATLTPGERAMLSFEDVLADEALTADASGLDVRAAVRMTVADHPHAVSIGWGWEEGPRETRALGMNINEGAQDYRTFKHVADVGAFLGESQQFPRSAAGEWIWARLRLAPDSDVAEYRVWFEGEPEPTTWLTASGMQSPVNDRVGLWFFADGDQFVDTDIAEFSVVPYGAEHSVPIVPPVTTITGGPSGTVETTSAEFSFEADVAGATFECRLDGGAWGACTSPAEYTGLDEGTYTFEVRAIADGLTGDAASRTWTVEFPTPAVPPVTTITGGPSGTVETTSAEFSFEADVAGATFECRLDGGAWGACTSPAGYTGLDEGTYTFEVRAIADGLTGDAASRTWTVEFPTPAVPPVTTITGGPSGTVETTSAEFSFEADVAGATFECRLDGGAWGACTSPAEYTGLDEGTYTFEVRAIADGLTGDAASRTWTVEFAVPPIGPTPDAVVPSGAVRFVADWNGDGIATPGWFYRSQWTILEQPGGPIVRFNYGRSTDTPVVGDWNGSGRQTVGVRRGNQWFLRNSNSSGPGQVAFAYGRSTDTPVVGDWNGSGRQTVGVRRGNQWFLRNSNSSGPGQVAFAYGRSTDTPVVGDWNGSGRQTVGVRRGNQWFLRNSNSSGPGQVAFAYGRSTDTPVVGDWNASGQQTAGVVRGSAWLLRNSNSTGEHDLDYTFR